MPTERCPRSKNKRDFAAPLIESDAERARFNETQARRLVGTRGLMGAAEADELASKLISFVKSLAKEPVVREGCISRAGTLR